MNHADSATQMQKTSSIYCLDATHEHNWTTKPDMIILQIYCMRNWLKATLLNERTLYYKYDSSKVLENNLAHLYWTWEYLPIKVSHTTTLTSHSLRKPTEQFT